MNGLINRKSYTWYLFEPEIKKSLQSVVDLNGKEILLDSTELRNKLHETEASERDINVICLITAVPGVRELINSEGSCKSEDFSRVIKNAEETTGLARDTVLSVISHVCGAIGINETLPVSENSAPLDFSPIASRSVLLDNYLSILRPFDVAFDSQNYTFRNSNSLDFETLMPLVKAGISKAQLYVGIWVLEHDKESALGIKLLEQASDSGNGIATTLLGDVYYKKGIECEKNGRMINDSWNLAYKYYTDFGATALNYGQRNALTTILNQGKYNLKLLRNSIIVLGITILLMFSVPGLMLTAPHPVFAIVCILFEIGLVAALAVIRKKYPYNSYELVPSLMFAVWILFAIFRIVF